MRDWIRYLGSVSCLSFYNSKISTAEYNLFLLSCLMIIECLLFAKHNLIFITDIWMLWLAIFLFYFLGLVNSEFGIIPNMQRHNPVPNRLNS